MLYQFLLNFVDIFGFLNVLNTLLLEQDYPYLPH